MRSQITSRKIRVITGGLFSDVLLRDSAVLFAGMMVVHLSNLIFQMAVSRALSDQEYALLAAFLGMLMILQRPLSTLTAGLSHYSSLLKQEGRLGDTRRLMRKWLVVTGIPGVFVGGVFLVLHEPITVFLHLDRPAPVLIAGLVMPALFWLPVLIGLNQGLQNFGWCSLSTMIGALVRVLFGAGFVWFVYPACGWAMLGHGFGLYASTGVLVLASLLVLRRIPSGSQSLPSLRLYVIRSFIVQAAFAFLMTADVVLVKHFIPQNTEFAYAATLARLVVFLPSVIVAAMFPKVSSDGVGTDEQRGIFYRSLLYTGICVGAAVLGCGLLARLFVQLLFGIGEASSSLVMMVVVMSGVMGVTAMLNVVIQFLLAQRRFRALIPVLVAAVLYGVVVWFRHEDAFDVASAAGFANVMALAGALWCIRRNPSNRRTKRSK